MFLLILMSLTHVSGSLHISGGYYEYLGFYFYLLDIFIFFYSYIIYCILQINVNNGNEFLDDGSDLL